MAKWVADVDFDRLAQRSIAVAHWTPGPSHGSTSTGAKAFRRGTAARSSEASSQSPAGSPSGSSSSRRGTSRFAPHFPGTARRKLHCAPPGSAMLRHRLDAVHSANAGCAPRARGAVEHRRWRSMRVGCTFGNPYVMGSRDRAHRDLRADPRLALANIPSLVSPRIPDLAVAVHVAGRRFCRPQSPLIPPTEARLGQHRDESRDSPEVGPHS